MYILILCHMTRRIGRWSSYLRWLGRESLAEGPNMNSAVHLEFVQAARVCRDVEYFFTPILTSSCSSLDQNVTRPEASGRVIMYCFETAASQAPSARMTMPKGGQWPLLDHCRATIRVVKAQAPLWLDT